MATFSIYTIAGNQSIVEGSFSGEGYPRLFEADSEIYIYGLSNALMMTPNTGTTFTNIMPPGYLTVKAICKSINTIIVPSNTST